MSDKRKRFWVSWYSDVPLEEFELHQPWWISGYEMQDDHDVPTICAAVLALDEYSAKNVIRYAYDKPPEHIRWRFVNARPDDWSPFVDRFPRAAWMKWPEKTQNQSESTMRPK